ncbi:MAG: aldo/keto reductase [Gemmatimonadaceae bacterium]|nr:aldo/keto reductase [Gemmatimonadaceae bacterium]
MANRTGEIPDGEAKKILARARDAAINTLDTAIAYGVSESRLGALGIEDFGVITKLPPYAGPQSGVAAWAREQVNGSLRRLRLPRLKGLLLHKSRQLLEPAGEDLYSALVAMKADGLVEQIGISLYDPGELDQLWTRFPLDVVQAPFNVVDRRMLTSGWLLRLQSSGVEFHARSAFLQGLLLMPYAERPAAFARWSPLWEAWHRWLREQDSTALQACLAFVLSQEGVDRIVVGVDTLNQFDEILRSVEAAAPTINPPLSLASEDADLVNPSHWGS